MTGSPDVIKTSITKTKITDDGELKIGVNMHDSLKYKDYDLVLSLSGLKIYDKKSDKILQLNATNNFIIINSNFSIPSITGALGKTKDTMGTVSELTGLTLIISNPATAGVFV